MSAASGLSGTEGVREALDRGETLPANWYSDPAVLRLEQERIFSRFWQYAGCAELVADGAGRRNALQCPYHAWTYDLDGTLRAAPRSEREAGFDASRYSLLPVAVATWGPLVFVNADRGGGPLA